MPYIKNTINLFKMIKVEKVFSGRYGKRTPHKEKKKPTPEDVRKVNERNRIKKLQWKILCNFDPGDYHITLTYKKEDRPGLEEAKNEVKVLLETLKKWYRKQGTELKYIKVMECKGNVHHHIVINQTEGALQLIRKLWKKGSVYPTVLYEEGEFLQLASYLVKEAEKSRKNPENPNKLSYSCSRNLIMPEKKTEIIQSESWAEVPVPPKGYWIPKESVTCGISDFNGRGYQYYMMIPIESIDNPENTADQYYKPRRAPSQRGLKQKFRKPVK